MGSRIALLRPGLVPYQDALEMQRRVADEVRERGREVLILLEHPHTYTLGVRGDERHLLLDASGFRMHGAEVVRTDRGGDVTYHGPGQIVGYPIVDIRSRGIGPAEYVRRIEQVLIATLGEFDIDASRIAGRPGVWTATGKIGAIGVRVSRGVTTHGFALNVNTDLSYFSHIVPCGIADAGVTSLWRELGEQQDMHAVERALIGAFEWQFDAVITEETSVGR